MTPASRGYRGLLLEALRSIVERGQDRVTDQRNADYGSDDRAEESEEARYKATPLKHPAPFRKTLLSF
jgi:hypothetical protein